MGNKSALQLEVEKEMGFEIDEDLFAYLCCGKWALNRPDGIVYTASGAIAEEGVTIAADWSVYSPGTILYIEGIGERTVQDRGGAISGQKIDVFFNNHEDALHFGRQEIRIKVISDTER